MWGQSVGMYFNPRLKRRSKKGSLAEFGPVMFVFLFFALFPMIDLMAVAVGVATIALAARQGASGAASSADYQSGINAMYREAVGIVNSGFGKFISLKPVAGYNGCGTDLWVVQTDFRTSQVKYCGPNASCPGPIDQSTFIYEYSTVCQYTVGPLCNLGAVPFIGNIPGLGQPAPIRYIGMMSVEYPDGLALAAAGPGPGFALRAFGAPAGPGPGSISVGSWSSTGP